MIRKLVDKFCTYPHSIRFFIFHRIRKFVIGYSRGHYYYCLSEATLLAHQLSIRKISVIEFGVAGGNGLIEIEKICQKLTRKYGVEFDIFGFDSGTIVNFICGTGRICGRVGQATRGRNKYRAKYDRPNDT